jgi:hypothetical protein
MMVSWAATMKISERIGLLSILDLVSVSVCPDFKRAATALLLAVSCPVDWTQDVETLKSNPEFRKAGYTVQAEFSRGYDKDSAKRRLSELEQAA